MAPPTKVSILAFQVGFGDCFLLRFHYPGDVRHVLIDFGSFPKASWLKGTGMRQIAEAIKHECGGKLQAVVATHRHADHISGFTTEEDDPGSVIASCNPEVVVQPWTEDPDARRNANKPTAAFMAGFAAQDPNERARAFARGLAFVDSLDAMEGLLPLIESEATALRLRDEGPMARQLAFLGENGLKNKSAVKNLMQMGANGNARYVFFGAPSGLEDVLPDVKISVLGPPTLQQTSSIKRYADKAPDQYWLTLTRTVLRLSSDAEQRPLFELTSTALQDPPAHARWLIDRLRSLRGRQLLEIVRSLDGVLNNTSVILLFEVGNKKLLFPGDAQLENWSYALGQPGVAATLEHVDFYKVGHHGSLNATPKRLLWEKFQRRNHGLQTAVSTLKGVHGGDHGKPTEVPRETLVTALQTESHFVTTEDLPHQAGAFQTVSIDI